MVKLEIDREGLQTANLKKLGYSFARYALPRLAAYFLRRDTRELPSHLVFCFASDLSASLSQLKHEETNSRTRLLFSGTSPMWKKSWLG